MAKASFECRSCHRMNTFDEWTVRNLRTIRCKYCGGLNRQEDIVYAEDRPTRPDEHSVEHKETEQGQR
jgi:NAD-dependent SIR2 family protein deacetylase